MRVVPRQDLAVVEAVARHFVVPWKKASGDWPDAYLIRAGKRVAIDVATIDAKGARGPAKIRLRFDKEVKRLVVALQNGLRDAVPDREAVIITVTAPIRQGARTAAALVSLAQEALARPAATADIADTIQGNHIRMRRLQGASSRGPNVIGFVHNPDSDLDALLAVAQSLLQHMGTTAARYAPKTFSGAHWLAIADDAALIPTEACRQICAELGISSHFDKILMVRGGKLVETLKP